MKNSEKPIYPIRTTHGKLCGEADSGWLKDYKMLTGISKREHFAGLAMQGIISNHAIIDNVNYLDWVAKLAIEMADKILKQLEETK